MPNLQKQCNTGREILPLRESMVSHGSTFQLKKPIQEAPPPLLISHLWLRLCIVSTSPITYSRSRQLLGAAGCDTRNSPHSISQSSTSKTPCRLDFNSSLRYFKGRLIQIQTLLMSIISTVVLTMQNPPIQPSSLDSRCIHGLQLWSRTMATCHSVLSISCTG
jgi:hypothetical protein